VDYDQVDSDWAYWAKRYYSESNLFSEKGFFPSEKNMVNETIKFISNHDTTSTQPLFIHFKTKSPHYPYEFPNDETGTFDEIGSPSENYTIGMKYIDIHLGRLYDYLETRDKKDNTIVIIVGDHANYLDKSIATALPTDDVLWTGAIISANVNIIGQYGINNSHCTQIDIMPTILHLSGDIAPRVSLGRNLLDTNFKESESFSFAVRPAGVRIDKGGYTYIIDRRHPSQFIKFPAFDGLMPKTDEKMLELSSEDYLKIADTWSYLIEENRVWKPENNALSTNKNLQPAFWNQ